jgi:hypothetical protein
MRPQFVLGRGCRDLKILYIMTVIIIATKILKHVVVCVQCVMQDMYYGKGETVYRVL